MTIHNAIGNLIDFYNVQFYNQGNNSYDTYEKLFICSGPHFQGTSVSELAKRGVTLNKIVVGKPCLQKDVVNTGLMDMNSLKNAINRAYKEGGWSAGVMFWQFSSDKNGQAIMTVINELKQACGKI
jgi:chitinase